MRRWSLSMVMILVGTLVATAGAPGVLAAPEDEIRVAGSGSIQVGPSTTHTFEVAVFVDGDGATDGWMTVMTGGGQIMGQVTCLAISGDQVVVGGQGVQPSFPSPINVGFTVFLTDNGPDGQLDTAIIDGPTADVTPDCGATSPLQLPLGYGQVTILRGPSDSGSASGQGTSQIGTTGIRTFEFDADRDPNGTVSGTFSISESQGFSVAGMIDCLDIRGGRAMVVGHGTVPFVGTFYATFFVDDLGPNGSGDRIAVNAYRSTAPTECVAVQEDDSDPIITGDIDVNGLGGGGGPAPAATVVASGAIQSGFGMTDSFDVTAIADGLGDLDGTVRVSRSGSAAQGTVTCLRVDGNQVVVGGQDTNFGGGGGGGGGGGPLLVWFTLYLTDNGPNGLTDTAYVDGPTNMAPPDCGSAPPSSEQSLSYGQVTILDGPSEPGTVTGDGTNDMGSGMTRTFSFDAARDGLGAVSGTFAITESQGFILSGTIDCLDIRGDRAMLIGHGPNTSGGGSPYMYATIFVEDGGPDGAGDSISLDTYRMDLPFGCLAAQTSPGGALLTGDIEVNAGAPMPTVATPEHPVIVSVTSPNAGTVTVTEAATNDPPPAGSGYTFLGHQLDITAPAASEANPLSLVFTVDAGLLASVDPDLTAATVAVFRNGTPVDDCTTDDEDDPATPDPCVSLRQTLSGGDDEGDARITVLTSAASGWNVGAEPDGTAPEYHAIAHAFTTDFATAYVVNEAGVAGGTMKDGGPARVEGTTVTRLTGVTGYGSPSGINESGSIVGTWDGKAVRIDGTTLTILPGLGGEYEAAADIDESGTVIGTSSTSGGATVGWIRVGTGTTALPTLGGDYTAPYRITESGLIIGAARTPAGDMHIVTWQDGSITDLGRPAGSSYAGVTDVNEAGTFIGGYGIPMGGEHGFVSDGTSLVDLESLGGTTTYPSEINEAGQIVGSSRNAAGQMRAVVWENGTIRDLGTLGGSESYGASINDVGQITGTSDTADGKQHGFLIDGGVMYDINDLVPPHSVELREAGPITDSGYILSGNLSGTAVLVPGPRPDAPYTVVDLGDPIGGQSYDVGVTDMNAAHQVTGSIDSQAFVHDGTTAFKLFPGFVESSATAINETGTVAGWASDGNDNEAFVYDGSVDFLGTLGGDSSYASDINDAGDVVGTADTAGGERHGFVHRDGAMIDLHDLGGVSSDARRINGSGTIIGTYSPANGVFRGFVSDGTTTTDLGTLGGNFSAPYAINAAGEIVGTTSTATQVNLAFRYVDGTMTNISPPGSSGSEGIDINEAGAVAGSYVDGSGTRRAFLLDDGGYTLIPGLGGSFATASDINAHGQVVGYATTSTSARGYLFDEDGLVDLTTQLPLGYEATVYVARKIGDDGVILVHGQTADHRSRALLLIPSELEPVPDPLTIDTSPAAPASVPKLGVFERPFQLSRSYGTDADDPSVVEVTGRFVAPSGATYVVPAWFGKDYTVQPGTGAGSSEAYLEVPTAPGTDGIWHVRFSPDEIGTWTYTIRARDKVSGQETTVVSAPMTVQVTASAARGQVERDPRDDRFLRYADGTPYLPMGHNVAFQQGEPVGHDGEHYVEPLFASMEAAGQNWTRIWMTDFNRNALEWSSGHWAGWYAGVGQYAGQSAFRIERQLEVAADHGLQVQLVLNDHGQVRSMVDGRWAENPYSSANGGPVPAANPEAFFTDPAAKDLFKQRLRYLVARYGAYRNLLAWELFNEVQFVGSDAANPYNSAQVRDDIVAWHAEMAAYLRLIDPYDHLITTSSDIESSLKDIWADPNIDLVQVHDYDAALTTRDVRFHGYVESLLAAYDKPVIIAEFGLPGSPEVEFDPVAAAPLDDREEHLVQATHLHNAAWASAMAGSGAMSWWWGAYIHASPDRHRTAPDFPANERVNPPLRDFFAAEDLAGMGLAASDISGPASVVALGMDDGSAGFAWIRDVDNEYGTGARPGDLDGRVLSDVVIGIDGFTDGTYRVEVHDPWGIAPMDDTHLAVANGGTLTVVLPPFTRDLAIKIRPVGPSTPTQPVTAEVTSPNAGPITIGESPTTDPPPVGSDFAFLGTQLEIGAPAASAALPLQIAITVDAGVLASVDPDLTATTLAVFRDGVPVPPCTASVADAAATPDPCVSQRETLSGGADEGDARITVLTSQASTWNIGSVPSATVPGAPTGVTVMRGDRQVGVSWTAPVDDGDSDITSYLVTASPGGATASVNGTTTTAIVTGLTNGTAYTFTVRATNSVGQGPASAPSAAVTPGPQLNNVITFTNPGNKTLLQSPVIVAPTASSGLPVTLTSSTAGVCTVSGFSITLLTAGTCTVTATQSGNLTYKAATPVPRTITVSQATQTITFVNPGAKTMLQTPVPVTATATSGLPVTLTSSTPAVCTVGGGEITLLGAGSCTITASQAGNVIYRAATPVPRTFTVSQVAQTITFAKPDPQTLLASPLTVTATASSGLPVTLASTTPAVCTVSGFEITLLIAGTCTVRATQPGTVVYRPATAVARSFNVTKAPQTITIPDPGPQSMLVPTVVLTPFASSGLPVTLSSTSTTICTVSGDVVTLKKAGTCKIRGVQAGNATYAAAPAFIRQFTVTAATAMPFVVAAGDALAVGGQPFSFHGAAIYGTSNSGAPVSASSTVAMAVQGGLNSLRLVNMFDETGQDANAPFAAADWQRVDGLIARARGAGLRVVLDLSAFRNHLVKRDIRAQGWQDDCLPAADRSAVDYTAIDPYRADLAGEWETFLDFVVDRVNSVNGVRYGADATIAVISIAGEPQPPASEECGKAASTAGLTDFYERTLGYLADIDPAHLRSNGGLIHTDWEELYGGGSSGIDGVAIFSLADNTLPSLHTYPPDYEPDGTPIDYQTPELGPVATSLGKPWFTEEFGWTQSVGDDVRAERFAWLYDEQDAYGSDGALFWNLGPESTGGSHDVNPGTPLTWAAVQAQ